MPPRPLEGIHPVFPAFFLEGGGLGVGAVDELLDGFLTRSVGGVAEELVQGVVHLDVRVLAADGVKKAEACLKGAEDASICNVELDAVAELALVLAEHGGEMGCTPEKSWQLKGIQLVCKAGGIKLRGSYELKGVGCAAPF